MIHIRFFSRTLMYSVLCILCLSNPMHGVLKLEKESLLPKKIKEKDSCEQHACVWGGLALAGIGSTALGVGWHLIRLFNQECSNVDSKNFVASDCDETEQLNVSSSQKHACYCNSLAEGAAALTITGSGLLGMTICIGSAWVTYKLLKMKFGIKPHNSIPTAVTLIHQSHEEDANNI